MNYDYTASEAYCKQIGLQWLPERVQYVDDMAKNYGFTQEQLDAAMRCHLWEVRLLFDPRSYTFLQRCLIALHYLFGRAAN